MRSFRTLDDLNPAGLRVLVRVDLNVPVENGVVSDATRLERILPTIRDIASRGGKVILLAGRNLSAFDVFIPDAA
jgi:phosphoglycerate kinase